MAIRLQWFGGTNEPVLFGQPDEDFWKNATAPIPAALQWPQPGSFDVQEPAGLFGQPDEDFQLIYIVPFPQSSAPIRVSSDDDFSVPAQQVVEEDSGAARISGLDRPGFTRLPVFEDDWAQAVVVAFGGEDEVWSNLLSRPVRVRDYIIYRVPDSGEIVLIQGYPPKYLYMQSIGPLLAMDTIEAKLTLESIRPNLYCESLP